MSPFLDVRITPFKLTPLSLQLQGEGANLSKKVGELEGFLRKLRADQASWESERERLNARLQVMEASARSEELNRYRAAFSVACDELYRRPKKMLGTVVMLRGRQSIL